MPNRCFPRVLAAALLCGVLLHSGRLAGSQTGPPAAPRDLETWSFYDSLTQETETGLYILMTGRNGPVNFSIVIRHKGRSTNAPPVSASFLFGGPLAGVSTEYMPTLRMAIDAGRPTQLMLEMESSRLATVGVRGRSGGGAARTIGSTPSVDTLRAMAEAQTVRITVFEDVYDLRFEQIRAIKAFTDRVSPRASGSTPTLTIDKKRFATAEPLVLWAGVDPAGAGAIPSERRQPGTLTITRPDKRTRTIDVPWPTDGLPSRGWTQAVVVDGEAPQQGEYRAVFTHANRESAPVFFHLEDVAVLRQITSSFAFPAGFRLATGNSVTLVVENKSRETIRVAKRGGRSGAVAVDLTGKGGTISRSLFYPEAALLEAGGLPGGSTYPLDPLTWSNVSGYPVDTVRAGGTLRVTLPIGPLLTAIQPALPAGEYDVKFETLLVVLIAERGGPWSDVSPIRIEATGTMKAVK
jgi:hypothetical protein